MQIELRESDEGQKLFINGELELEGDVISAKDMLQAIRSWGDPNVRIDITYRRYIPTKEAA